MNDVCVWTEISIRQSVTFSLDGRVTHVPDDMHDTNMQLVPWCGNTKRCQVGWKQKKKDIQQPVFASGHPPDY